MPTKFKLTVDRHPDDTLNGRPYVTENGEHVAEGYLNECRIARLSVMVDRANALPEITEAAKALLTVIGKPGMGDIHLRPWMALREAIHAAEKAMR